MFVLKEQTVVIAAEPEDPENPNRLLSRNVGSFVLPLSVAKEFQKIFNGLDLDAVNAVATAQS